MNTRRLAAIVSADVVGSSRLMEKDEPGTLAAIDSILSEIVAAEAVRHHGRVVKTTGDGALLEFPSPVDAVVCGIEVQRAVTERALLQPEDKRIVLRIGVNLGDVTFADDGDIYGD